MVLPQPQPGLTSSAKQSGGGSSNNMSAYSAQSTAPGGNEPDYSGMTPIQRQILQFIHKNPHEDGVHVSAMAREIDGCTAQDIRFAISPLFSIDSDRRSPARRWKHSWIREMCIRRLMTPISSFPLNLYQLLTVFISA